MNKITYQHCPICESEAIADIMPIKDHSISKQEFALAQCSDCGFLFTNYVPVEEEIGPYYQSEDYISHSDTQKGLTSKLYHWARKKMLKRKYKLVKGLNTGKKLLDVGAGTGYFPHEMKTNGYSVVGVEVDDNARNYAKEKFDLTIYPSLNEAFQAESENFDTITMWHVLEHVYDLHGYLQKFHHRLNTNGAVVIAVPNADSLDGQHYKDKWAAYDVPRHLWHFTPRTLAKLAELNGFKVEKMHHLPFDPFYISILSEKYKGGSLGFLKGGWIGFRSFLRGKKDVTKASSVVYILRKG